MTEVLIYGSGGFAREVAWLAEEAGYTVKGFIDDNPNRIGRSVNGVPVVSFNDARVWLHEAKLVLAVGSPQTRMKLYQKSMAAGFSFVTLVHPHVEKSDRVEIGDGTVITAGNILTVNIRLGQQVQINLDCTVGHDVVMEDFATLAPGVHVSGWVHIKRGAYIGTGAVIINGREGQPLIIGEESVIGAGAVVTRDIQDFATAVGVPARVIKRRDKADEV